MLLLLIIGIGLVVFFLILGFVKGGKDTLKHLGLSTSIKNTGYDSLSTILIIRDIIIKSLRKDGTNVIDLNIVHEIEGRYQGILSTHDRLCCNALLSYQRCLLSLHSFAVTRKLCTFAVRLVDDTSLQYKVN